jgi:hypothetical protein
MIKLATELVVVARGEVGVEEIDASNSGPRVEEYQSATSLGGTGFPWCAAFVCWCVREAAKACGVAFTPTFHRPTTAGAWALEAWSLAQDASTWTKKLPKRDIKAGDIIVFTFSHCGIAASGCDETGHFACIEGNTDHAGSREGGSVWLRTRRSSQVRSRIRFRV